MYSSTFVFEILYTSPKCDLIYKELVSKTSLESLSEEDESTVPNGFSSALKPRG